MSKILLDTSFLLSIKHFEDETSWDKFVSTVKDNHPINTVIESCILYDHIFVDAIPVNQIEKTSSLYPLFQLFTKVSLSDEEEEKLYNDLYSHPIFNNNFRSYLKNIDNKEAKEFLNDFFNYSYGSRASAMHSIIQNQIRSYSSNKEAFDYTFALLLRYLYYVELQKKQGAELVLHPSKAFLSPMARKHANEIVPTQINASRIIQEFDQSINRGFQNFSEMYLGDMGVSVNLPMIARHILRQCKSYSDLPHIINKVHHSPCAKKFREGMTALAEAVKDGKKTTVHETLQKLDEAKRKWIENIDYDPLKKTKKISFSIPLLGIGTDVEVTDFDLKKRSISDNLLTFIHELIKND